MATAIAAVCGGPFHILITFCTMMFSKCLSCLVPSQLQFMPSYFRFCVVSLNNPVA